MTYIVREQFESRYGIPRGVTWDEEINGYVRFNLNLCSDDQWANHLNLWCCWRDSRKFMVVTLPALREDSDADDIAGVGLVIPMFDRGYDEALEEARVAIESVGIRVEFEE